MWKNGWNKRKFMKQIKERNGFKRRVDNYNECMYRIDPNDSSSQACLVGAFIPDGVYENVVRKQSYTDKGFYESSEAVDELLTKRRDLQLYMPLSVENLEDLQRIHDNYNIVNEFDSGVYETDHSLKFMVELYLDMIREAGV